MKINKCKHDSIMLYWQDIEDRTLPHTCYVECAECGLSDDFTFQTSAEAHEHWNTAHPDIDELKAEIAELQSKLDFMNKQPLMIVKPPDAVIYENALDANRQLKAVNKRIEAELETYKKALETLHKIYVDTFNLTQQYIGKPSEPYSINNILASVHTNTKAKECK